MRLPASGLRAARAPASIGHRSAACNAGSDCQGISRPAHAPCLDSASMSGRLPCPGAAAPLRRHTSGTPITACGMGPCLSVPPHCMPASTAQAPRCCTERCEAGPDHGHSRRFAGRLLPHGRGRQPACGRRARHGPQRASPVEAPLQLQLSLSCMLWRLRGSRDMPSHLPLCCRGWPGCTCGSLSWLPAPAGQHKSRTDSCNAAHSVQQRTSRHLLVAQHFAGQSAGLPGCARALSLLTGAGIFCLFCGGYSWLWPGQLPPCP